MSMAMARQVRTGLPVDIRMMNFTASLAQACLVLLAVVGAVWWGIRNPSFSVQAIAVSGDIRHLNELTLKANVVPRLQGNFFTMDLNQAREVFESVPWVRHATLSREFPGRLHVTLEEHQPVAHWGAEQNSKMLNRQGEVFVVNLDEVDETNLPHLSGPDDESGNVWQMYQLLEQAFAPMGQPMKELTLSPNGSWSVVFANRVRWELGRDERDALIRKVNEVMASLPLVTRRLNKTWDDLESVDLRHAHGYALKLKGITVKPPLAAKQTSLMR